MSKHERLLMAMFGSLMVGLGIIVFACVARANQTEVIPDVKFEWVGNPNKETSVWIDRTEEATVYKFQGDYSWRIEGDDLIVTVAGGE